MEEPKARIKLDPARVRQTMAGYAEVNRLGAAERRARLRDMSEAEARQIFDDLCATHLGIAAQGDDWEKMNSIRLEQKVSLRRAFERLARFRHLV